MTVDAEQAIVFAAKLRESLRRAEGLPESVVESIDVLIDAWEWEIALEIFCTQIHEYDLELSATEYEYFEALGNELGVAVAQLLGEKSVE